MEELVYDFKGTTDFSAAKDCYVEIKSTGSFTVLDENKHIVGPDHALDRSFRMFLHKDEHIIIEALADVRFTLRESILPPRGEVVSSKSMVEIVPAEEMSVYDRLRAELLAQMDMLAEARGMDTWDDDDEDYDVDDEEWETPLTPYEYKEMYEEYLKESGDVQEAADNSTDSSTVDPAPDAGSAASDDSSE